MATGGRPLTATRDSRGAPTPPWRRPKRGGGDPAPPGPRPAAPDRLPRGAPALPPPGGASRRTAPPPRPAGRPAYEGQVGGAILEQPAQDGGRGLAVAAEIEVDGQRSGSPEPERLELPAVELAVRQAQVHVPGQGL